VPHITHFEPLEVDMRLDRKSRAVAVVSNYGGAPWSRHPGQKYRNRFATNGRVDLYGRRSWKDYRSHLFSRASFPSNYVGEIPGDWPAGDKRQLLAGYSVAVALENMNEPYYFTEKMVEAARAGCIPIYHPDPESKATVLRGAFWIDPADYTNDPESTISAAIGHDQAEVQEKNAAWFRNNALLSESSVYKVYSRIGDILSS
jgi:hypothetical protein